MDERINRVPGVKQTVREGSVSNNRKQKTRSKKSQSPREIIRFIGEVDRPFLILVIVLVCFGSVMIFSASYAYAMQFFKDSYYFARKQLGWIVGGMLVLALAAKFGDYNLIKKISLPFFITAYILNLIVAFVPSLSTEAGGATRQLVIGPINFQPSELLKLGVIMLIARYASDCFALMKSFKFGIAPFLGLIAAITLVMVKQEHLSGLIIICALIFVMMYIGGSNKMWLGIGVLGGGAGAALLANVFEHAKRRMMVWQDPFEYMYKEGGAGWQPAQSLYAIYSGGFWGVGLGRSNQKRLFLPEPQNDYIFAIICEELGFFGAIIIIGLFAALIWRGFVIAMKATSKFASLLVMGLTLNVAIHVILNIAVVTNTIPSTGITLPFFSYGGTSLWILLFEMGLILSVSRYSYLSK